MMIAKFASNFARPAILALPLFLSGAVLSSADEITQLPVTATFVVSGGFWNSGPDGIPGATGETGAQKPTTGRGYYKLVAIRQGDGTARLYLQMIASEVSGPLLVQSVELEEFTAIRPYVTGIMPESTTGVGQTPGFFATVYLKTAADAPRAEEWTVLIDDLGDIRVERASN